MRANTVAVFVVGVLVLAGAGITVSAGQGTTDGCSLLTQARVSSVLGVAVGPGQRIVPSNALGCGWYEPSDTSHRGKRVVLDVFGPIGRLTPVDRFNNGKAPIQGVTKTPVSGVGDDAYYITSPGLGTGLNVRKGAAAFQIRVYGWSPDEIMAKEKSLAQDTLGKL